MAEVQKPLRAVLACSAEAAVAALPAMGRVMTALRAPGTVHERIGTVGAAGLADGVLAIGGETHDLRIAASSVARVVADRSGRMRERVLPRLEFQDAAGQVLFSAIALSDPDAFEAAVAGLGEGEALAPEPRTAEASTPAEVAEDDPAQVLLAGLAGQVVTVAMQAGDAVQRWTGLLEVPRAVMGHVNIIQPDFHLHLRGGQVGAWREEDGGYTALDASGAPFGLTIRPEPA